MRLRIERTALALPGQSNLAVTIDGGIRCMWRTLDPPTKVPRLRLGGGRRLIISSRSRRIPVGHPGPSRPFNLRVIAE